MHLLTLTRPLIILLFTLVAGSISMAAAAGTTDTTVIGTITAIDTENRELVVSPVRSPGAAGKTSPVTIIHVRLNWDVGPEIPFISLLPGCATRGNAVRIDGILDGRDFQAETIHGCGAGDFSDDTGVRYRLNRARGTCAPR